VEKRSYGLLMFRRRGRAVEVFLVHPGGPYWTNKDSGAWSIPKGEIDPGEGGLEAARREFHEETGFQSEGPFIPLKPIRQPSGKIIHAWAFQGDGDVADIRSNTFTMEWPPRSGTYQEFPEVDRAGWFTLETATEKIIHGQAGFLQELTGLITGVD
jgi:predicted NUDIX family NTP pyrophosphohydrolase